MFCCARFLEDGLWYRAQITSLDPLAQSVTVHFVDHGNSEVVNLSSDLRLLTSELTTSPCQAIKCCLAHSAWENKQTSTFETATMDKPLQATFNKLDKGAWVVSLSDGVTCINQLPGLQASTTTSEKPQINKLELSVDDEHSVYLVSVDSHDDVILQLASHVTDLETLMSDIANKPPVVNLPCREAQVGMGCLGQFTEDDTWYRARILECDTDRAKVRYIDYGNEEWLSEDRLAPICEEFCHLPEVCFSCTLHGGSDGDISGEKSGEQIMERYGETDLCCKIVSKNAGNISVKLLCEGEDVMAELLASKREVSAGICEDLGKTAVVRSYINKKLKEGERIEITCCHIDSPDKLWCQLVKDQEVLHELMNQLDEAYGALELGDMLLETFVPGTACCGQFLEDDGWYRAEVLGKDDEGVKVRYVDYGNVEVLPSSRVRSLMPKFEEIPQQAVAFHLNNVQPVGEEWSPDALTLVEEFISDKTLIGIVKNFSETNAEGVIYGTGEDSETSLNDLLVEGGFSSRVPESNQPEAEPEISAKSEDEELGGLTYVQNSVSVGDKLNLFYVTANSPASIWCQFSDTESDLLNLMESLGAFYSNLAPEEYTLDDPTVGSICSAQFTEDDSWYRGEVLKISRNILVHFVDYGNSEELPVSKVKRLKQEFAALPKQAIRCSLTGISPQSKDEWTHEKNEKMEELCSEKSFVGEILGITDDVLQVSFHDLESQESLLDQLTQAGLVTKQSDTPMAVAESLVKEPVLSIGKSELPVKYSYSRFSDGEQCVFHPVSVESPVSIWAQDIRNEQKFKVLQEKMLEVYSSPSAASLEAAHVGAACCVLFANSWCRAEITQLIANEMAVVFFVDWGNPGISAVADLKKLDSDFLELPKQALSLSLADFKPSDVWEPEVLGKLKELCDCDKLTTKIVRSFEEKLEVELYGGEVNEKSVNQILKEFISEKGGKASGKPEEMEQVVEENIDEADVESEEAVPGAPEETVEDTHVPEDTVVPEDTIVHEHTAAPEDAAAQEDTSAPEDTAVPEDTVVPQDTTIPEETGVHEVEEILESQALSKNDGRAEDFEKDSSDLGAISVSPIEVNESKPKQRSAIRFLFLLNNIAKYSNSKYPIDKYPRY